MFSSKVRKYGLIIFLLVLTLRSTGQLDPILTQFNFNIQAINPAYAGMWDKIGFVSLVRKQWTGIDNSPTTQLISFHSPMKYERFERTGIGFNIINDHFAREKRLSFFADYSHEVLLNSQTFLRFGLKFGFMNFQNPLTQYQLIDNKFDIMFQEDINLKVLPNFGVGTFFYTDKYYVGLSIPKLIENKFVVNRSNYSSLAELRHLYLNAGYLFNLGYNVVFKPTVMMRMTKNTPLQFDLSANFLLYEKLWLGSMLRTGDAICFLFQWIFDNNIRIGYAMDVTFTEIFRHQYGTYEFTLSYDVDFYRRRYIHPKHF